MNNKDMPAMPTPYMDQACGGGGELYCDQSGLTKREELAARAMQGILANGSLIDVIGDAESEWVAMNAIRIADALLAELDKE